MQNTLLDVLAFYDSYAETWDSRFGNQASDFHFLNARWDSFLEALPTHTKSMKALELGVGTGVYIHRAAPLFQKIIAVDGSERMLDGLKKKYKKFDIANVETLCCDVVSMQSISNASIDVVYFFGLVEHIVEIDAFFKEIHRILKQDGLIVGVMPNKKCPWYGFRRYVRGTGSHCSTDRYYGFDDVCAWAEKYGFIATKNIYWGCVPAGLPRLPFQVLKFLEKPILLSFLRRWAGGLTFQLKKSNPIFHNQQ